MKLNKIIKISIIGVLFIGVQLMYSQTTKQVSSASITATEIFYQISGKTEAPSEIITIGNNDSNKKYAFNFESGGWLILKSNNLEMIAFSEKGNFKANKNPLTKEASFNVAQFSKVDKKNYVKNSNFISANKNVEAYVEPFLLDTWGGVNCYDSQGSNIYPTNYYTPNHASPGCVAIATSQILHYFEWPITGVGNHIYNDNYDGTFMRHEAFFDNTTYDWGNMKNEYMLVDSTIPEQEAVGTLMYHTGVALEMDYELTGSTNNLDNVPFVLKNFFRFTGTYHSNSWSSFWSEIYNHIQLERPVPIAIHNSANDEGHVMVANGYKLLGGNSYYHINWGWYDEAPTNNAWYNIQGWNAGDQGYDVIDGAVFYMLPEPQITTVTPNGTGNDFVVSWDVSSHITADEFTLEQKVDQSNSWVEVANGITQNNHTITNPTGNVYQFRVKSMIDGSYYLNSWSEIKVHAISGTYNGFGSFEGAQHVYAKQTPDFDVDFTGDFTFETWLRVHGGNQNGDVILDQKNVFGLTIEEVTATNYSVKFKSHSSGLSIISSATGSKPLNEQWVHVAVSKTGNTVKLFIDGELRDSANSGYNLISSNSALNIGEKYHGSYSSFIIADFDQLRLSSIGRYAANFTPDQTVEFSSDNDTKAYFTFQNVHRNRLKDNEYNFSVLAVNSTNFVVWNFDDSSTASISQKEFNEIFKVYPNPTNDYIRINYSENHNIQLEDLTFSLIDITGKIVKEITIDALNNKIDLTNITSGTYILTAKADNFSASQKIIKQ